MPLRMGYNIILLAHLAHHSNCLITHMLARIVLFYFTIVQIPHLWYNTHTIIYIDTLLF